jgi:hypothetical protein
MNPLREHIGHFYSGGFSRLKTHASDRTADTGLEEKGSSRPLYWRNGQRGGTSRKAGWDFEGPR